MFKDTKATSNNLPNAEIESTYSSTVYTYPIDVSSILNENAKDYVGALSIDDKPAGKVDFHLFKGSDDIKAIKIATFFASEFPNNEYEFTKMMDANSGENVHVILHKGNGETKDNTKQKVVISYNSEEKELEIKENDYEKALYFTLKDLKLAKGVDAELIIKYYKNKDDSSKQPKEYKLKIYNKKAES